jgi:hypothetical protein
MQNDSIDTLLLRHYGYTALAPEGLEQRLQAAIRSEVTAMQQQQEAIERLSTLQFNRRRAVRLVAVGTLGLGLLSAALEGLQMLEASVLGQDASQTVFP